MTANLENSGMATGLEKISFHSNPKEGNTKECSNDHTTELISHVSKVVLKILQARIQQYMNQELLDIQTGFRRHRGTWDQIANIHWIIEKAREFNKASTSTSLTMLRLLTVWITRNWKNYYRDGSTRPSYMPLEKHVETVRIRHGTMDWFKIGKGVSQGCKLSPCLFNLYVEYIIRNARLDVAQTGVKIAGRNINNLRYAEDNTLMAESEEELKRLLMKVKEESESANLKLNIKKLRL